MNMNSIKWKWLITIISIILLLSIASFLTSAMLVQSLNEETIRNNESEAEFLRSSMDDSWERIFKCSWQIFYSEKAKQMESTETKSMLPYDIRSGFDDYLIANPMLDDCYLYYPKSDLIIGTKGVLSSHAYWALLFGRSGDISAEDWVSSLFLTQNSGYFTTQTKNGIELYYRISKAQAGNRVMVVKINQDELKKTLNSICEKNNTGLLALVNAEGNIYAYSGNAEKFIDSETNTIISDHLKDCLVTKQQSDIASLYYLTITENGTVYEISNNSKRLSFVVLILAITLSVVLAIGFVYRRTKPVDLLIERFPEDTGVFEDELYYLGHKIDDLLDKNRQNIEQLLHQQNLMIRQSFLFEAIRMDSATSRDIEQIATTYGLQLEKDHFIVIIRERSGDDFSDKILKYLNEKDMEDNIICWTQNQDLDVFLLNYDESVVDNQSIPEQVMKELREQSSTTSRIVRSNNAKYLAEIRGCYLDCLLQLDRSENTLIAGRGSFTSRIKNSERDSLLDIFQNYLFDENYQSAQQILPDLCTTVFEATDDPIQFASQKFKILSWLTLKKQQIPKWLVTAYIEENDPKKIQTCISNILTELKSMRADEVKSNVDCIAAKCRCIIDEQYANPMLGLSMLSDQIGFSQSYISHSFKDKYGIVLSQYTNQVRIKHAKLLMKDGSKSIKEIALQVGFSSDAQFIRVFKKMEQITPNAFRTKANG